MATNFWELLQQHQGDLTKSGRTVADYLVQHAAEAQYLSISSLAKECCVAEATVFRFCRALGFEGYHEMRIALAQANATGALVNGCRHGNFVRARQRPADDYYQRHPEQSFAGGGGQGFGADAQGPAGVLPWSGRQHVYCK